MVFGGKASFHLLLLSSLLLGGCSGFESSTNFGSSGGKPVASPQVKATLPDGKNIQSASPFDLACGADAAGPIKIRAAANRVGGLKGQICPSGAVSSAQNFVFIVDISGSMQQNDPSTGSSCGRLEAAKALAATFKTQANQDKIKIGVVTFSTSASVQSPYTPLDQIDSIITESTFCQHAGSTNYEAAFDSVGSMLEPNSHDNVLFLLSDGIPTTSGQSISNGFATFDESGGKAAGQEALNNLRGRDSGLVLNAVFLAPQNSDVFGVKDEAQSYLSTLTGSADHVAVVTAAADLAAQAVKLQTSSGFTATKLELTLHVDGQPDSIVAGTLQNSQSSAGAPITFTTDTFQLRGDKATINKLSAKITDNAGHAYTQTYDLILDNSTLGLEPI